MLLEEDGETAMVQWLGCLFEFKAILDLKHVSRQAKTLHY